MIWRGPMVIGAIRQILTSVEWGELDYLIIDLPPGTGDASLTLAQEVEIDGVVIVSTPQDLALADVSRGVQMFNTVNVPILGVVENMSYHICENCGNHSHIFGDSGAENMAKNMNLQFLGKIPLHQNIRETTDKGQPIVVSQPKSQFTQAYNSIAMNIIKYCTNK
eukprot:TRINITY_DN6058_c0_g2_i2.p1 TRINITY_DN6058_c0_g2~~TRINITY_DN6058_c0_g2_i2.p1  ORF type:complete len:165 (-),score=40.23 TRINITY_DN6058_c0_g2_i2:9-503(-)